MCIDRLSQRFGIRGGFYAEPEIRRYRYGNKLASASSFALKEFKDQLSQCLLFAKAYQRKDKLEGAFVLDLAKRLPYAARLKYIDFLDENYGSTREPSFDSLLKFVSREETCKSSDFSILLLSDSSSERSAESGTAAGGKPNLCPVSQTSAQPTAPTTEAAGKW